MKNKFILIFWIFIMSFCSNPIEKKMQELKKCEITLQDIRVVNYKILLIPPVPKIKFKADVEVYNTNEIPVTIERFQFQILKKSKKKDEIMLANVVSAEETLIPALERKLITLDLETALEENKKSDIVFFIKEFLKSWLVDREIELIFDGSVEFNTILGKMNIPIRETKVISVRTKKE
ncbi:MAG: LEA type 2 family protein [Leptospiraceae bacterium]|nr:LEA type 2 family protein [Leptospiraceae bacterium]